MSLVDVYDDLITKDLLLELEQYVSGFTYSRFETDNEEYDFKTNTHDFDHKDPLLIKCQQLFWNKLKNNVDIILTRLYCNKILAGDSPTSHYDGKYDVDTTVLVYVNSEWDHNEGGETLFYNEDKEVVQAVVPKPGRVAIFPANILHSARPPLPYVTKPRYTVAYKYEYGLLV
tara:strand:+ start:3160 stop:3678 length:519 start_codon:yes stop_codon:yes gene_type:complete